MEKNLENTKYNRNVRNEVNNLYEVEEIVDKKISFGKIYYKVKWVGYGGDEMTWEPIENLLSSKNLIERFEKKENKFNYDSYHEKNSITDDYNLVTHNDEINFFVSNQDNNVLNLNSNPIFLGHKIKKSSTLKQFPNSLKKSNWEDLNGDMRSFQLEEIEKNKNLKTKSFSRKKKIRNGTYKYYPTEKYKSSTKDYNFINPGGIKNIKTRNLSQKYISDVDYDDYLKENINLDKPIKIHLAKIIEDKLFFLVSWESRPDGTVPDNTLVSNRVMKKYFPYLLIDFYEEKLKIREPQLPLVTNNVEKSEGDTVQVSLESNQRKEDTMDNSIIQKSNIITDK